MKFSKTVRISFAVIVIICFAILSYADYVVTNGAVTMSATAQGLGLSSTLQGVTGATIYVDGTASTDGIRWYCGPTAPTATTGIEALDGTTITLNSGDQVSSFQAILNSGATGAKIFYIIVGK